MTVFINDVKISFLLSHLTPQIACSRPDHQSSSRETHGDQDRTRSRNAAKKAHLLLNNLLELGRRDALGRRCRRPSTRVHQEGGAHAHNKRRRQLLPLHRSARSGGPVTSRRVCRLSVAAGSQACEVLGRRRSRDAPFYPCRGAPGLIRHKLWDCGRRGPHTHRSGKREMRLFHGRLDRTVDESDNGRGGV